MTDGHSGATIEDWYSEDRIFEPAPEFSAAALVSDPAVFDRAAADPVAFWAEAARELITWETDFTTPLEWDPPDARWFVGGRLNVSYNCLDRHVEAGNGDRVALHWEGEPGDTRTITYAELLADVSRFANVLSDLGVETGDRVCIYMPMIPEAVVAMLACTRIGAAHTVVFGGFSPDSLIDRINDAGRGRRGHRRRRLPPGPALPAQAERRRRARRRARRCAASWSSTDAAATST